MKSVLKLALVASVITVFAYTPAKAEHHETPNEPAIHHEEEIMMDSEGASDMEYHEDMTDEEHMDGMEDEHPNDDMYQDNEDNMPEENSGY